MCIRDSLQTVRESERVRIARELHDELGQALACLRIELSILRDDLMAAQPELHERFAALLKHLDTAIQSMRRLSSELRPRVLDEQGLSAAIEWQAREFQRRTGIECGIMPPFPEVTLDRDRSTALFRIFQEALTNVARHSGAAWVQVTLEDLPAEIRLRVRDNGRGFSDDDLAERRSMGLLGMQERALVLGGKVSIESAPGQGTAVSVTLPRGGTP